MTRTGIVDEAKRESRSSHPNLWTKFGTNAEKKKASDSNPVLTQWDKKRKRGKDTSHRREGVSGLDNLNAHDDLFSFLPLAVHS